MELTDEQMRGSLSIKPLGHRETIKKKVQVWRKEGFYDDPHLRPNNDS